jgi:hypothetical protein
MELINVIQAQTSPDTKSGVKSVIKSIVRFGKKGGLKDDAKKGNKYQQKLLDKAQNDDEYQYLLKAINVFMVDHLTAKHALKIIALNDAKIRSARK